MAKLLLVRHGQASYGQVDYDRLSPRGEAQARAVGEALARERPSALFVGPHVRQQQTAAFARAAAPSLPEPITLDGLAEYPGFEMVKAFAAAEPARFELGNRFFDEILGKWARDEWRADGVERVGDFRTRVEAALGHAIANAPSGGTICCVTSAGPIGVAAGLVFGASPQHMIRASTVIRNASITELKLRTRAFAWQPNHVSLVGFNSTAHLTTDLVTEY